jgi:hypothetical protein
MQALSPGRKSVLLEIVIPNLGGVDHVIEADASDLVQRFRLRCRRLSAVSMTSLRSVGIVDWSNELTAEGVQAVKALAAELKRVERGPAGAPFLRTSGY